MIVRRRRKKITRHDKANTPGANGTRRGKAYSRRPGFFSRSLPFYQTPKSLNLRADLTNAFLQARDVFLGIGRIAPFVLGLRHEWIVPEFENRLNSVCKDVASLNDYEVHLSTKVQFLLDAVLGFITIEQNDLFQVLTIVSVVGIPPTLMAGIYGMNFKFMPELNWAWGYPFGLAIIALSALIPLVWFKWRGWF